MHSGTWSATEDYPSGTYVPLSMGLPSRAPWASRWRTGRLTSVAPVEGVSTPHADGSLKVLCFSAERRGSAVADVDGDGNHGTRGVIHIESRKHRTEPTEYLVSFGGNSSGVFYLAKVSGFDPLTALLRRLGVPAPAMRVALQVLMAEPRHKIPHVTLTQDHFRELGLSD